MTASKRFLYLSEETLAGLDIATGEAIEAIEELIHGRSLAKVWSAPKAVVQPPDGRYMMATLAASDDPPFMSVKSLIMNARNTERGLPQINSLVTLLDGETGMPVAVMDGNWITAVRTAALSAVAAKRMARPESSRAAFIGCGVQAQSHLQAFASMFPLTEIRACGRGPTNIEALCQSAEDLGLSAAAFVSAKEAVSGADLIISSVTYSAELEPFLDARWLKPGSFSTVPDLAVPWVKDSLSEFDRIVIDDVEQEASMANKLVRSDLVAGDLSGLVLAEIDGRHEDGERTAFIFRAHPLGDLALAVLAYQKARERSRGTTITA